MTGSLRWVGLKCLDCGHEAQVACGTIEAAISSELTLASLARAWARFRCAQCSSRRAIVSTSDGRALINADDMKHCSACGDPIVLPRLAAVPGTTLCFACAPDHGLARRRPAREEEWPAPPDHLARCPLCRNSTVVRENSKSGHRFVGCTSYPRCNWTANLPRRRNLVRVAELLRGA